MFTLFILVLLQFQSSINAQDQEVPEALSEALTKELEQEYDLPSLINEILKQKIEGHDPNSSHNLVIWI